MICKSCKEDKPIEQYYTHRRVCKICVKKKNKLYYQINSNERKKYGKIYYHKNKKHVLQHNNQEDQKKLRKEYNSKYYIDNKNALNEKHRLYRLKKKSEKKNEKN